MFKILFSFILRILLIHRLKFECPIPKWDRMAKLFTDFGILAFVMIPRI